MNKILRNGIIAAIVLGTVGTSSFYNYTYAKGGGAVEEGNGAKADGTYSVAIGNEAEASESYAIAIGSNTQSTAERGISMGYGAVASGVFSMALGSSSETKGYCSVALGAAAKAVGEHSVALGENATAFSKSSVAIGFGSKAKDEYEFSVGKDVTDGVRDGYPAEAIYRRITHVADGVNDHDAVTLSQARAFINGDIDATNTTSSVTGAKIKAALDQKVNVDLDNLTDTGTNKVKTLAGEQITETVTQDFVTEKVKKGNVSSTTLDVTGDGKMVGSDLKIDLKDGSVTKEKLANDLKTEIENKANVDLGNLTSAGTSKVKTLAGEQITETVTQDFVTEKVKKGNVSSTTLDVTGDGKMVGSDLKIDLKDGIVTKKKLSSDLKAEIENKANTSDLTAYAKTDATNITGESLTKWQSALGNGTIAENDKGLVTGGTVHTALKGKANVDLDNLTDTGTSKVKTLAGEQIIATVTQDFVTEKVKKGSVSSTTLDVMGDGKLVDSDLTIDLKDGSVTKEKLSSDLQTEIENKANTSDLSSYAKTDATNITGESLTKWQSALGNGTIAENNKGLVTGGTVYTALKTKADKSDLSSYAKTDATNITGDSLTKWQSALGNGTIAENNKGLVTGGTVYTALKGKADKNAENIEVLAWKKKLGLVDAQATQDSTNNIFTQVTNINNDITNLKGGFIVSDGTKSKEITLGGTTKDKLTFSSADSNLTATFNETNKTISYGVNVSNLIGDINKSDTKITNVDLTNNQTITNLKTEIQNITGGSGTTGSLSTKADTNATNLTKTEDILAWQKKLGLADNSATVTPGSTTTTNLFTTVNQLKAGYTVKAGTNTFDMKLGDTTAPTIEFAGDSTNGLDVAADKAGKKITYAINKDKLVKYIAGDLIKQMNGESTPGSGDPSGHGTGEQGQTTPLPVLTNVSTGFNIAVGTDSKNFTFGKGKETNKLTFAGTNDETSVSISGEDGTPTVTVGLADAFKTKVNNKADKSDLTKLETKVTNITNGKTKIDVKNIDLATNNTFKTLQTSVEGKANKNADNITVSDWATKLGIGEVATGNANLVTGGKVFDAIKDKADKSALNDYAKNSALAELGKKVTDITNGTTKIDLTKIDLSTNNTFKTLQTSVEGKANKNADNITVSDWATKLGIGEVATGNTNLVTGGKVFDAIKDKADKSALNDYAKNSAVTELETKVKNITNGTTKIDLTNIDLSTNNTFKTLQTSVEGKADANGSNVTAPAKWAEKLGTGEVVKDNKELVTGGKVYTAVQGKADKDAGNIEVLAWKKKLGLIDAQATQDSTTNISTQVTNISNDITNLKGGFIVSDGTNRKEIALGGTTKDTLTFASADKNLTATFNETNKTVSYGVNVANLIGDINKSGTKITNVDWSKFEGINFYSGGTSNGTTYTPSAKVEDKWQSSRIVFGKGLKAEELKDANNNKYTKISVIGGGQGGKSAYEIWRDHKESDNSQPNKGKSETDFMNYMKGKDCSADIQHIVDNVTKGLSSMDGRINRVSAGAAALSALRPISNEYDPDNKLDFSVGFGYYKGENAVAIGAYYRPGPNTIVSLGGAFNGDDNLLNAGLSWKLGKTTPKEKHQTQLQQEIDALKEKNGAMEKTIQEQNEKIKELEVLVRSVIHK